MTIYLLRHTKPNVPAETFYGQTDIDIVQEEFEKNVPELKELLPIKELDLIVSSPLKRCLKLANQLANHQEINTDKRIMEMNFGDWEMRNWNTINSSKMEEWRKNFVTARTPNGESHYDLYKRVENFWNELLTLPYQKVCLVTHAGVIRSLLALILEMPILKGFSIKLHYNELIRIDRLEQNTYKVEFVTNEEAH